MKKTETIRMTEGLWAEIVKILNAVTIPAPGCVVAAIMNDVNAAEVVPEQSPAAMRADALDAAMKGDQA